eukprot:m.93802 g.93802  ORF g.93802 m.93802 type:complete len:1000 (+) comp13412_c0_seq2:172-3171(+)
MSSKFQKVLLLLIVLQCKSICQADNFQQWLSSLTINLDDIQIDVPKTDWTFLFQFQCTNATLSSIQSSLADKHDAFKLSMQGLGIGCTGSWVLKGALGSASGTAEARVLPSAITFATSIEYENISIPEKDYKKIVGKGHFVQLPSKIISNGCAVSLKIGTVELKIEHKSIGKDLLIKIIDWLMKNKIVENAIDYVVGNGLCKFFNTTLLEALNDQVEIVNNKTRPFIPRRPIPPAQHCPAGDVDLELEPLFTVLNGLINSYIGPEGINIIENNITHGTGIGSLDILNNYTLNLNLAGLGNASVRLHDIVLRGMNSWTSLDLFQVYGPVSIFSSLGSNVSGIDLPMAITLNLSGNLSDPVPLQEHALLSLNMSHVKVDASSEVALKEAVLENYSSFELGCIKKATDVVNMTSLNVDFLLDALSINTVKCNSSSLDFEFGTALNNLVLSFVNGYKQNLAAVINGLLLEEIREGINEAYSEINATCTAPPPGHKRAIWMSTEMGCFFSFCLLVASLIFTWKQRQLRRRHDGRGLYASLPNSPKQSQFSSIQDSSDYNFDEATADNIMDLSSLMTSSRLHWLVRYGMLVSILTTAAMFFGTDTIPWAHVKLKFTAGDQEYGFPTIYELALVDSIKDMWNAGIGLVAVGSVLFSGLWPFVCCGSLFFCWILPDGYFGLSVARRDRLLHVCSHCAKWSLYNIFTIMVLRAGLKIHVDYTVTDTNSPLNATIPVSIDCRMNWLIGFSEILCCLAMMLMANLTLHYHRKDLALRIKQGLKVTGLELEANSQQKDSQASRSWKPKVMHAGLLAAFALIGYAASQQNICQFVYGGLVGWLLERQPEPQDIVRHTAIHLGTSIVQSDGVMLAHERTVQVCYFLVCFAGTGSHILFLLLMPVLKMSKSKKLFLARLSYSWASMDVLLLSVTMGVYANHQFSVYMLDKKFKAINELVEKFFMEYRGSRAMYYSYADLDHGYWMMLASVAYISIYFAGYVCHLPGYSFGLKGY